MHNFPIRIEVVAVADGATDCKGQSKMTPGQSWEMRCHTPEGVCSIAFAAFYPFAMSCRFADKTLPERGRGYVDCVCPHGRATFRISRVAE